MDAVKTLTLTDFLLARIAEDEDLVQQPGDFSEDTESVRGPGWGTTDCRLCDWYSFGGYESVSEEAAYEHLERVHRRARVLAECKAKRRIVELHSDWPVLVETPAEFNADPVADIDSAVFRMSKQIAWTTEQKYREHFGTEPPTGPILRALATVYADHPDFRDDWS